MDSLDKISEIILSSKKIGITYHVSPDGDAVGSALALLEGIKYLNKDAYLISKDIISDNLQFLKLSKNATGKINTPLKDTDTVVVLDCGNYERISANLENYTGSLLNIDHHISNNKYGDYNYIDSEAAATSEIVYKLIEKLGIDFSIIDDNIKEIGTCLYTALVTDTGGFRHSNVTYKTHKIASELKKIGVDNTNVHQNLFDNKSFEEIRLIGKSLNNMKLLFDKKVSLIKIPIRYAHELGIEIGDTSDIISFGLQIKDVEVAILIKEIENGTKVSLRSKNDFDVRKVAEKFGGGGHIKASGITLKGIGINEAEEKILDEIEKELV